MSSFSRPCPRSASLPPMWSSSTSIAAASRPCSLTLDREQDSDRWSSYTTSGQETWQILSQWMWNLRQELSQQWQPTSMRLTAFSPPRTDPLPSPDLSAAGPSFGPPQWARAARVGSLGGQDFLPQADGTLRGPQAAPLYPQDRPPQHDPDIRRLFAPSTFACRAF